MAPMARSLLARASNATGMYNDGPYLEEANGTLVATWFNCPRVSEGSCVCGERPPWAIAAIGNRSRAPRDKLLSLENHVGNPHDDK